MSQMRVTCFLIKINLEYTIRETHVYLFYLSQKKEKAPWFKRKEKEQEIIEELW